MNDNVLIGGVFHVGVQIYGHEYGYGMTEEPGIPGVCDCPPRCNWQHRYKCTVDLGPSEMSSKEVSDLLEELKQSPEWDGFKYELLHHNCLHFAGHVCNRLGVRHMPGWLDRFGRAAVQIQNVHEQLSDNWGRAKGVAEDFKKDFRYIRNSLSENAPVVRASIVGFSSGLYEAARRRLTGDGDTLAEGYQSRTSSETNVNMVATVAGPPASAGNAESVKSVSKESVDAFLLLDSAPEVTKEAPPLEAAEESQRW